MYTIGKKNAAFTADVETAVRQQLRELEADARFKTEAGYTTDNATYPDNQIPFLEKHIAYLRSHPTTNPAHYMSNLRIKLKIR